MNIFNYLVANQGDYGYKPKPASQSTDAPPGTAGKVEMLSQRISSGEDLWHPDDATDFTHVKNGDILDPIEERSRRLAIIRKLSGGIRR